MLLQSSYRLFAPIYDLFVTQATARARQRSIGHLPSGQQLKVLISGAGTGLDFPHLPGQHQYTALDLTRSMLGRAREKIQGREMRLVQGDSMQLPFADASFDTVILHLILAVVPDSRLCLQETCRVLKPGGQILLFDKFLKPGERAWIRRGLGWFTSGIVTRMDVVFEDVIACTPALKVARDEPAMSGGWFRLIEMRKQI